MNNLLETPLISEIRRNHGLEHATLNILSKWHPNKPMAGHSNPTGFFILADVPTESLREAVTEALSRMQNGERHLAIHPGCGTNYVVAGVLAGTLSWLGLVGAKSTREKLDRLPMVIVLSALGFMLSQPLAPKVQEKITTSGDPGNMVIVDIYPVRPGVHRVVTKG